MKTFNMTGGGLSLASVSSAARRADRGWNVVGRPRLMVLYAVVLGPFGLALAGEGDWVHTPSGTTFPARIEQRFVRGYLDSSLMTNSAVKVEYLYGDGTRVIVRVRPAPADAKGPTILDGDSRSDATPSFMRELESLKAKVTDEDDSARVVSQQRFHAALHKKGPLKGPVGMKATIVAKENHDILLCERNGYFVAFTVTYPKTEWMKYGMTYTDVAHFLGWAPLKPAGPEKTGLQKQ